MKYRLFPLLTLLVGFSFFAHAEDVSMDKPISPMRYGLGVGFESVATSLGNVMSLSVQSDFIGSGVVASRLRLGGVFGFNSNFDNMVLGPKFEYFFFKKREIGLFTELITYYVRQLTAAPENGVGVNALLGVEVAVPTIEDLKIGLTYGLVMNYFGNNDAYGLDNFTIGIANASTIGNITIHYYF